MTVKFRPVNAYEFRFAADGHAHFIRPSGGRGRQSHDEVAVDGKWGFAAEKLDLALAFSAAENAYFLIALQHHPVAEYVG